MTNSTVVANVKLMADLWQEMDDLDEALREVPDTQYDWYLEMSRDAYAEFAALVEGRATALPIAA